MAATAAFVVWGCTEMGRSFGDQPEILMLGMKTGSYRGTQVAGIKLIPATGEGKTQDSPLQGLHTPWHLPTGGPCWRKLEGEALGPQTAPLQNRILPSCVFRC